MMEQSHPAIGILLEVSGYSILAPVAIGIIRYGQLHGALKIFWWFVFVSALFEIVLNYTGIKGIENLVIINVFVIVQYVFFSWVFYRAFNSQVIKKGIAGMVAVFVAFGAVNLLFGQGTGRFNTWTMGLESLLLMAVVLLFLYETFRQGRVPYLQRYPMFWVASGALLYFAGNLFLFIFINYVLAGSTNAAYAEWGIHSAINITANLCYTAALWLSPTK